MSKATRKRGHRGFTLVEMLVTFTMVMVASSIGLPALLNYLHRARIEGAARQATMMMHASRLEAITRGIPSVVVLDEVAGELVAFADVDGVAATDPPDGLFNPVSGDGYRETDYELGRYELPPGVVFVDPDGNAGEDAVEGFANPAPIPAKCAFFRIDGSVADVGAFRFADGRGNYLESRVAAASTARVEMRKWDEVLSEWRTQGEEGNWTWH
jgi:type II secretory pathway pseudopilin PulG